MNKGHRVAQSASRPIIGHKTRRTTGCQTNKQTSSVLNPLLTPPSSSPNTSSDETDPGQPTSSTSFSSHPRSRIPLRINSENGNIRPPNTSRCPRQVYKGKQAPRDRITSSSSDQAPGTAQTSRQNETSTLNANDSRSENIPASVEEQEQSDCETQGAIDEVERVLRKKARQIKALKKDQTILQGNVDKTKKENKELRAKQRRTLKLLSKTRQRNVYLAFQLQVVKKRRQTALQQLRQERRATGRLRKTHHQTKELLINTEKTNASLSKELENAEETNKRHLSRLEEFQRNESQLKTEAEVDRKQRREAEQCLVAKLEECRVFRRKYDALCQSLNNIQSDRSRAEAQVKELTEKTDKQEAKIAQLDEEIQSGFDARQADSEKISCLGAEKITLSKKNQTLEAEKTCLESKSQNLDEKNKTLETEKLRLESKSQDLNQINEALETEISSIESERKTLNEQTETLARQNLAHKMNFLHLVALLQISCQKLVDQMAESNQLRIEIEEAAEREKKLSASLEKAKRIKKPTRRGPRTNGKQPSWLRKKGELKLKYGMFQQSVAVGEIHFERRR